MSDNSCFVIRQNADATQKIVFAGQFSEDVVSRCQTHADKTGRPCILHHKGQKRTYTPITRLPEKQIQGLGWQCTTKTGGFFFVDKQSDKYYTARRRRGKDEIVAWLNFKKGRFSLNIVSDKFQMEKAFPMGIRLETAVNMVYSHAQWK